MFLWTAQLNSKFGQENLILIRKHGQRGTLYCILTYELYSILSIPLLPFIMYADPRRQKSNKTKSYVDALPLGVEEVDRHLSPGLTTGGSRWAYDETGGGN